MTVETRPELQPETLGSFRVLRRLTSGSGREVFLAEGAGGRAVLKVLGAPRLDEGLLDPRIAEEARAYARLSHPNLVKVVDLFSVDGSLVIALEYVDGSTLNVVRAALGRLQQQLDDGCWIYVASSIFAGLAAAHAARDGHGKSAPILHRNINPTNVYVAWDGGVKLGDFGVASIALAMHNSNPGLTWGSYGYYAPEQTRAMPMGPHTDVYSVMLLLWELLAGRKAVERGERSEVELLDLMASPNIPPLAQIRPDIDLRVSEVVRAGLQRDATKRTVDAADAYKILRSVGDIDAARERFATALARILSEGTLPSGAHPVVSRAPEPKPPPPPRPLPPPRRPPPLLRPSPPTLVRAVTPETALDAQRESASVRPTSHSAPAATAPGPRRLGAGAAVAVVCALSFAAAFLALLVGRDPTATVRPVPPVQAALVATRSTEPAPVEPPPPAASAASAGVADSAPESTVTASTPSPDPPLPPDVAELRLPPYADGHRIYVDGRVVGEGTDPIRVRCGARSVRIGSAGAVRQVNVPCGQALELK